MFRRLRIELVILLVFISLFRLFLIERGSLSFPDERRYFNSRDAILSIGGGHLKDFFTQLSSTGARPADALVRLVPAGLQILLTKTTGIPFLDPRSCLIPLFMNVIVSIILLLVFIKISEKAFCGDRFAVFTAALLFALFANNNMYVRHILPYDISACIFYFLWYRILTKKNDSLTFLSCAAFGVASGFGFSVYPGYFFMPVFLAVFIAAKHAGGKTGMRPIILCAAGYGAGFVSIIAGWEICAILGGTSYVESSYHMSRSVVQGDLKESFSFLFKYLVEIEGAAGLMLITGSAVYTVLSISRFISGKRLKQRVISSFENSHGNLSDSGIKTDFLLIGFYAMTAWYISHASVAYFLEKIVVNARLLHILFPLMILALVDVCRAIPYFRLRKTVYLLVMLVSFSGFLVFAVKYLPLAYPRDVLYRYRINSSVLPSQCRFNESFALEAVETYGNSFNCPSNSDTALMLVNMSFIVWPDYYKPFVPAKDMRLIYSGRYWLIPYRFEGLCPLYRVRMKNYDYRVSIYKRGN